MVGVTILEEEVLIKGTIQREDTKANEGQAQEEKVEIKDVIIVVLKDISKEIAGRGFKMKRTKNHKKMQMYQLLVKNHILGMFLQ